MSKSLKLNIAERLVAIGIFNDPENKVATSDLKVYLDDVAKFRITDLDKETVKWEEIKNDKGEITNVKWDDKDSGPTEIQIESFTEKFLKDKLNKLEYSAGSDLVSSVVSLLEKLNN